VANYPAIYSDTYDPLFPAGSLDAHVELYLGTWTDITGYVYQRNPITIGRGRPDQSSQVNPSQCSLTLNDRDARFSINNPMSPYSGLLNRNTPLRVSIPNALLPAPYSTTYLRMEDDQVSYASAAAAAGFELSGSIDVRVDADISGYGNVLLASLWSASATVNQRSWKFGLLSTGQLYFKYSTDGTTAHVTEIDSEPRLPITVGRQCLRATLDATTGNVAFYTAAAGSIAAGPWTQIGSTISGSGAATLFAPTAAALTVGYSAGSAYDASSVTYLNGAVYDMELRNGIGGTVVAKPAFNAQNPGTTTWTDSAANVWSLAGSAALTNRAYRYHGELCETPKATDESATDIYTNTAAAGVLRRLQQGSTPLNSAMYRAYVRQTGAGAPVAYWPCEDGTASRQIASALPGGQAMQVSGSPQFASNTAVASSAALPVLGGSIWQAPVPQGATWTQNVLQLVAAFPASPASETNGEVLASIYTTGTVARMDLQYNPSGTGSWTVVGYDGTGAQLFNSGAFDDTYTNTNGNYFLFTFGLTLSGGVVSWNLTFYAPSTPTVENATGTIAGASLGAITKVAVNTNGTCQQVAVGHLAVQAAAGANMISPFNAWNGETAANRIFRLCAEEGIQARIIGHPELTSQMGNQTIQTLTALLQECETTDRGMLFEPRTCLGIGYRTPLSMYNQAAKATASYTGGALDKAFASTCDDLTTFNDVTASNTDGSSARQVLASGPMSILSPPNGVGRVDTSVQVNIMSDAQLAGIAQWILHLSTDYHDRFPVIPFNMARSETPPAVALLEVGDLLAVTNPPTWLQPDEIDQLAAGFSETLGPYLVWQINVNGVPAYPYRIATVRTGTAVHVDSAGSQLSVPASASAATLTVVQTQSYYSPWTTNASDFPFDINVGGERMTVTGITNTTSPQIFAVTRSVNGVVKSHQAGEQVALWYTPIVGMRTGA
jgi:hypothetical protein